MQQYFCGCVGMDVRVGWYVFYKKKAIRVFMCVFVILREEKLNCKSTIQSLCDQWSFPARHPMGKVCYCAQTKSS